VLRRFGVCLALAVAAAVVLAVPAWGHVSVSPSTATAGGFATLTFQVPNETDNANTIKLEVQFPTEHPIADASVQPVPGWTFTVNKEKLTTPVTTDEGATLNEAVKSITWTASSGGGIKPGEFQQFRVSVGLPDFEDTLLFPTAQTYDKSVGDSGNTVNWVEQTPAGGPEPEHPAPSVTLTASSGDGHGSATPTTDKATTAVSLPHDVATSSDVDSAKTVSYVALGVGIVGLIVAIAALVLGRKRPGPAA
jgi:uncharacterized protein YcnI